ncbi:MAG: hypothetical protein J1F03_00165 [Oscillospiraceae bacterium]|nr:hypothetical protein [Oscillospiraceae bacterium]
MGGRGASSGFSDKGKRYGTEYHAVYQSGNIKFVVFNEGANTAPMETMTKGRVYVTVDKSTDELKYISYYDKHNKRYKQIDLQHFHIVDGVKEKPHVHKGYFHNEKGDYRLSPKEQKMVEKIKKTWYNRHSK